VEYWLNMHKIGYLLARRGDKAVMVHTFLFLTMDGTPEASWDCRNASWGPLGVSPETKFEQSFVRLDRSIARFWKNSFKWIAQKICSKNRVPAWGTGISQWSRVGA
jgi:hypothetical protein